MKKISIYIIAAAVSLTGFTSCKKYLDDVAQNPNDPLDVSPNALMANIELATFTNFNGNLNRRAAVFTQHLAGIDGQYVGVANYKINEGDVTNEWKTLYTGALVNCKLLMDKLGSQSPNFKGMVQVLYALNIGQATDMWGDVPDSDALKGLSQNYTPQYDAQQTVINNMQFMLTDAVNNLKQPAGANLFAPGSYDYMFQGDVEKWLGAAYALKARYANRLSKKNASQSATDALAYLDSAYAHGFTSSASDANAIFGEKGNENNQWYAFENQRGYVKMGKFFIDMMVMNNDPRLPYFATTDASGTTYTGADVDPANATFDESGLGSYYGSPTSNAPILTFVEAKFIEAECKLRLGDATGAANTHNEAVKASISTITGGPDATYEAAHASETSATITLEKIMTEKYVALFTQSETWADWRRTGYPVLTPNPSGVVSDIPRILPTSQDERNYNPNAIIVSSVLQKVWWDQ